MIIDYYNMPSDEIEWLDEEKRLYEDSCKNYHELNKY